MQETLPTVVGGFRTILADPPWRFSNRTGKVAPEHKRLGRYSTMSLDEIKQLPVPLSAADNSHLYLWVPNALLPEGLSVMESWGFRYVSNIVWAKRRKDGGPDGRGVGFYFRNVTEILLFGVRGHMRTLQAGRSQVNMIETRKREHSRKPDEQYELIESCSPGPYLEMFARYPRPNWTVWGNEAAEDVTPQGKCFPGYTGGDIEKNGVIPQLTSHQRLSEDTSKALAKLLANRYQNGSSIRELAMECNFSIARVRALLALAKVDLRARGRSAL
ncbi:MT-A70 family methyltransferase [Parasutterella sp.]|uniref:MT-A70 family methyltransferase n=1 Tax=Parasutterella sp. TaxID=2049037 RepID=UPI003520D2D5